MTPTVHYASYLVNGQEVHGTAELLVGTGYLFRQDGNRTATVIRYTDGDLLLYGNCAIADRQHARDTEGR